jgi:DNA ligase D-like protein (predicted 3'-phosphoesterase)
MAGPRAGHGGPAQNGAPGGNTPGGNGPGGNGPGGNGPGGNGSSRRVASLAEYRRKRHLSRSGEPGAGQPAGGPQRRGRQRDGPRRRPRFVIQQHAASTGQFDFRLEVAGVLKSWAVPKGPSTDPRDKRLAVATQDHPLGYANFEGVIRSGEYGTGQVSVWDRGFFVNRSHDRQGRPVEVEAALERGHLTFELHGKKLRGGYSLTHMRGRGGDQWLLVKAADDLADARRRPVSTQSASVLSDLTIRPQRGEKDT